MKKEDLIHHVHQVFPYSPTAQFMCAFLEKREIEPPKTLEALQKQQAVTRCLRVLSSEFLGGREARSEPLAVDTENSPVFVALLVAFEVLPDRELSSVRGAYGVHEMFAKAQELHDLFWQEQVEEMAQRNLPLDSLSFTTTEARTQTKSINPTSTSKSTLPRSHLPAKKRRGTLSSEEEEYEVIAPHSVPRPIKKSRVPSLSTASREGTRRRIHLTKQYWNEEGKSLVVCPKCWVLDVQQHQGRCRAEVDRPEHITVVDAHRSLYEIRFPFEDKKGRRAACPECNRVMNPSALNDHECAE